MAKMRSKSEEKRQSIMQAGTELFTRSGFAATTMDQIAELAGVSKQTVYSHFGNKSDLFAACVQACCLSSHLIGGIQVDESDLAQSFTQIALRFLKMLDSEEARNAHRACVAESETNPELSRLFYESGPKPLIREMQLVMQQLADKGLLSIENPYFAAVQFLLIVQGEVQLRSELNVKERWDEQTRSAYVESAVKVFLKGYSKAVP